jgi:hypothetical protein
MGGGSDGLWWSEFGFHAAVIVAEGLSLPCSVWAALRNASASRFFPFLVLRHSTLQPLIPLLGDRRSQLQNADEPLNAERSGGRVPAHGFNGFFARDADSGAESIVGI